MVSAPDSQSSGQGSGPRGRFSKVPQLYGPFSSVTVPFVSQERRGFNSSKFTVIFLFVPLKAFQKTGFPKQAVGSFPIGFSGPKSFRDFRETGPWPGHCVVFLGKALYSRGASLRPGA